MGTDIHFTFGKASESELDVAVMVAEPKTISYNALSFGRSEDYGFSWDRYVWLFTFFGEDRDDGCKPFTDITARREQTRLWLQWMTQSHNADNHPWDSWNTFSESHRIGDWGFMVIGIDELLAFDYDQVLQVRDPEVKGKAVTYSPHPEGQTYRESLEGPGLFEMLDYCKASGWQFLIVGFDN